MAKTRIYQVETHEVKATWRLVEARSQAAARKHVVDGAVGEATIATGKRIAELVGVGVKVELAE